jgi:hypothetical protein
VSCIGDVLGTAAAILNCAALALPLGTWGVVQ